MYVLIFLKILESFQGSQALGSQDPTEESTQKTRGMTFPTDTFAIHM